MSLKKMRFIECRFTKTSLLAVLLGLSLLFSSACSSEAAKQKHLARGEEYLQKRKFHEAVMEFRAAADIDKNSADAHWGLARAHENLGEVYEAIRRTAAGRRNSRPNNLEAKSKLGNYFLLLTPPQIDETEKIIDEIFARESEFYRRSHPESQPFRRAEQTGKRNSRRSQSSRRNQAEPHRILHQSRALFHEAGQTGGSRSRRFKKASRSMKNRRSVMSNTAIFTIFPNRPAEAEAQFKKAIEVEPQNFEARESDRRILSRVKEISKKPNRLIKI